MQPLAKHFRSASLAIALVGFSGASLGAQEQTAGAEPLQGQVIEVSGDYAKVTFPTAEMQAGIQKGQSARLVRPADDATQAATGRVTAVQADYIVVRFPSVEPHVGDTVLFVAGAGQVGDTEEGDAEENADEEEKPRKASRETLQERKARLEAERKKLAEELREKWLARLAARGIEAWQPATEEEHEAALARYKKMGQEVQALLPGVQLYETKYFLFYTNIPPAQAAPYIRYLDAMYVMMGRLFGVAENQDVWLGRKAPVFAFLTQEQFLAFERRYFQMQPIGAYGICHQNPNTGEVVIACYRGDDPHDFGQMLVHETSHGFVFRYQTKANLPVWVDEGMAEYIGEKMVPASDAVRNKERAGLLQLKETRRLGPNFFEKEAKLNSWQYGVAVSLTKFLIANSQERYVAFIEGMKEGLEWHAALQQAYNATPEEVIILYSRAIGVPALGL